MFAGIESDEAEGASIEFHEVMTRLKQRLKAGP